MDSVETFPLYIPGLQTDEGIITFGGKLVSPEVLLDRAPKLGRGSYPAIKFSP